MTTNFQMDLKDVKIKSKYAYWITTGELVKVVGDYNTMALILTIDGAHMVHTSNLIFYYVKG